MSSCMKVYTCKSCNKSSDDVRFYASITTHCAECWKARQRNYHKETAADRREYDRQRNKLPHRREARTNYQKTERGKAVHEASAARWMEKNRKKRAAQNAVNNAIRDGRMTRPDRCGKCNKKGPVQGHHDDYDRPLDVRWLCVSCHSAHHEAQRRRPGESA